MLAVQYTRETGNSRIVRDKIAELNTLIQSWNSHVQSGNKIIRIINKHDLNKGDTLNLKLLDLCDQLNYVMCQMDTIISKIENIAGNIEAVAKLHDSSNLFKTWPAKKFEESILQIYNAYNEELTIKKEIAESIAHQESILHGTALEAAWMYEPKISGEIKFILDALLMECGLI